MNDMNLYPYLTQERRQLRQQGVEGAYQAGTHTPHNDERFEREEYR
jgi:hypothetical protein